jgi:hypothetical protein
MNEEEKAKKERLAELNREAPLIRDFLEESIALLYERAIGFEIESATSGEALRALAPRIKALPEDSRERLRTRFASALKRLEREDAK